MEHNKEMLTRICGVADAWRKLKAENENGQLADDQFDFVTDVAADQISKIIADCGKA